MCAIAGFCGINLDIPTLLNAQRHRGPDDSGVFTDENISLVHNRLAIVDIKNGSQPMHLGGLSIVFNGEIYNHLEIRKKYFKNEVFKTKSDTETLLFLYQKFGGDFLNLLDGMFAFCIYDKNKKTLFFAKDKAGKKPLFFYQKNGAFAFASEIVALKQIGLKENKQAISSYIKTGFFTQNSAYQNVTSLAAGSFAWLDLNTLKLTTSRYFSPENYKIKKMSLKSAKNELEALLDLSVKRRIESSDLEVGAFLSGGIDSSLIVAIASKYKSDLKTFTVSFKGSYDESHLASLVAQKYATKHQNIRLDMDLKDLVPKVLKNYSQPFFDSSALPSFVVSSSAKKIVNVALCGDGADEIFGGYRRAVFVKNYEKIFKFLAFFAPNLPAPTNKQSFYNYLYRGIKNAKLTDFKRYLGLTTDIVSGFYEHFDESFDDEILTRLKQINALPKTPLQKMILNDFYLLFGFNLLPKMDIASMANSLETRSPFLSKEILEFGFSLDDKYKIKGTTTKYLLRHLAKDYLPKELINAPKRGFEVPLKTWIFGELRELIFDTLSGKPYVLEYVKKEFLNDLLQNAKSEQDAKIIWALFSVEFWKKNFF